VLLMDATWMTCLARRIVAGAIWRDPTKTGPFTFSIGLLPTSYVVDKVRCKQKIHTNHTHTHTHTHQKKEKRKEQLHYYVYSAHISLGPDHHCLGSLLTESWECSLMCIRNPKHCWLRSQSWVLLKSYLKQSVQQYWVSHLWPKKE
jgi:hypothetical protein